MALAVLLGEYAIIAVRFDGSDLAQRGGWLGRFSNAGEVFSIAAVTLFAGLLLHSAPLRAALAEISLVLPTPSVGWLAVHFAAFGLCLACGVGLFARPSADGVGLVLVALGIISGVGAVSALARALLGPAAMTLGRLLARSTAAGALLGIAARQAGLYTRLLWPRLTAGTLDLSSWILQRFSSEQVHVDAPHALLGLGQFEVEIAQACSGVEGMALVAVFVTGYIYQFRSELVIWRALLLVPVSVALAWVANAVRIAALVAIGAWWSPDVAFGGFHSKAGWLLFCSIALGIVVVTNRTPLFSRGARARTAESSAPLSDDTPTHNPTAGYCLPFLAVLGVGLLSGLFASVLDTLYALRLAAAAGTLYWTRGYWRTAFARRASWSAPLWGATVFALWLWLTPIDNDVIRAMTGGLAELSPLARAAWVCGRILGMIAMAPIVEELAFRGFLQRRLVTRDFDGVRYEQVGLVGVLGSALAFGALHPSWLLGTAAGVAYALASRTRGGLLDAVLAHAVTNALLVGWALAFERWDLLG